MMGFGSSCTITLAYSTRVLVEFRGAQGGSGAASNNTYSVRYADVAATSAPANGTAATAFTNVAGQAISSFAPSSELVQYEAGGIVTGLTTGHTYWFDMALLGGSGSAALQGSACTLMEL
jgi:hypothetical protein